MLSLLSNIVFRFDVENDGTAVNVLNSLLKMFSSNEDACDRMPVFVEDTISIYIYIYIDLSI